MTGLPKKLAVYPGSFDPLTNGHVDLIDRVSALSVFDELTVLIGINPIKKTRFTLAERIEMLEAVIQPYPCVTIDQYSGPHGAICTGARCLCDYSRAASVLRF